MSKTKSLTFDDAHKILTQSLIDVFGAEIPEAVDEAAKRLMEEYCKVCNERLRQEVSQ